MKIRMAFGGVSGLGGLAEDTGGEGGTHFPGFGVEGHVADFMGSFDFCRHFEGGESW